MTLSDRLIPMLSLLARVLTLSVCWAAGAHAAGAIATAVADSGLRYYWVTDQPSRIRAEAEVLALCMRRAEEDRHREACKLRDSADGPGYGAVVVADNTKIGWKFASDLQAAVEGAYRLCVRQSGGRCERKAEAAWSDGAVASANIAIPAPPAKKSVAAPVESPVVQPAAKGSAAPQEANVMAPSGTWTKAGGGPTLQFFVDRATLGRAGDVVTAWVLYSMPEESIANLSEHNCKTGEYRTRAWRHFDTPMGKGKAVDGQAQEPWRPAAKDAFYADVMKALCGAGAVRPGAT